MRLIHATTSCEEGLDGLSRLMTPYRTYSCGAGAVGSDFTWAEALPQAHMGAQLPQAGILHARTQRSGWAVWSYNSACATSQTCRATAPWCRRRKQSTPHLERAPQRGVAARDGGVVSRAHVELAVVLEEKWPAGGVKGGRCRLRLDDRFRFHLPTRLRVAQGGGCAQAEAVQGLSHRAGDGDTRCGALWNAL